MFAEGVGTCLFQFIGGAAASNSLSTGLATSAIGNGLALVVLMYATAGLVSALLFWMCALISDFSTYEA